MTLTSVARRTRGRYSYIACLERALGDADTVLDVGCGNNSPLGRLTRRPSFSVGVDLYEPWLNESSTKGIHDEYILLDVLSIGDVFDPGSFDAVLATDVLEHLERESGRELLQAMERIAKGRVVVTTPNGYVDQGETWGNPLQRHRCGWTPGELRELGYAVFGINGLRFLHGERGIVRWRPRRLWQLVSDLARPLVYPRPELAFQLLCVKSARARRPSHAREIGDGHSWTRASAKKRSKRSIT